MLQASKYNSKYNFLCTLGNQEIIVPGGSEIVEALQVGIMEKYRAVQRKRNLLTNLMEEHGDVLLKVEPPPDPSESPTRDEKKVT